MAAARRVTGITVRVARPADAARIGMIHVRSSRDAYAGLLPAAALAALDPVERAAMWRRQLQSGMARGLAVAEDGDTIIGFACCARQRTPALTADGFAGEVTVLYVLKAAHRRGAGRLLMQAMARRLIAEGYRGMALWVLAANAPARSFYERLGGTIVAARVNDGHDEVAYGWRDLTPLWREA